MRYRVTLTQKSLRDYGDGKRYEHEESMQFEFSDRDAMQEFLYYVSVGSANIVAEIEFIKEED